jgi:predicted NBD/HSP70 family sugar kinase
MVSRGTTQQSSAPYNRRIVLDVIRRQGSVSRKEIVDAVSLSPQTVVNITRDLESIGLIASRRLKGVRSRGQPPIAFELNPSGGSSIGISLEPGGASAALINLVGDVIRKQEVEFDVRKQRQVLACMLDLVKDLIGGSSSSERPWGVGIALPGPLAGTDISFLGPTTLEGWGDLTILDELRDLTGLHVNYSVDSVAGALGEALFGVAKRLDNFYYLHLSAGLGGALVVNRSAYKGANSNATEVGHIPVVPDGKPCYCGNRGCLERYLSLHSLSEELGVCNLPVTGLPGHGKETLARMLAANDAPLLAWCAQAAERLRDAVRIIENMLDPHTIVIGGSAPKVLVERLVALAQPLHKSVRGGVALPGERILLSQRQEDSSILGAAVLPIYDMLSPRFEVLLKDRPRDLKVAGLLGQKMSNRAERL